MQNNEDRGSLSEKFRNFGAAPSEGLWERISDELGEEKKKRGIIWWWTSGLAAIIVAVLVVSWPESRTKTAAVPGTPHPKTEQRSSQPHVAAPGSQTDPTAVFPASAGTHPDRHPANREIPTDRARQQAPANTFPSSGTKLMAESDPEIPVPADADPLTAGDPPTEGDSLARSETLTTDSSVGYVPETFIPAFNPKWSIAFHGGGSNGRAAIASEQATYDNLGTVSNSPSPTGSANIPIRRYWSADLLVSRSLSPRFSIESGLEAGWFYSGQLESDNSAYASGSVTTLTFAIPVSVRMLVCSTRKFRLDAGAGILNHVPFYQRISAVPQSTESMQFLENSRSMTYVPAAQLDLSLQYRLTKSWFLDVRPQVRHYFGVPKNGDPGAAPYISGNWWGGTIGLGWRF